MSKLVKQTLIDALTVEVARREGTAAEIAAALNAPEVTGHETGTITAEQAYAVISPATMLALDETAGSGAGAAGEAIWLISALADVDPVDLAEGSAGRQTVEALVAAGVMPQAEFDALMAAAQTDVLGDSIGQKLGIGHIYPAFIEDVT